MGRVKYHQHTRFYRPEGFEYRLDIVGGEVPVYGPNVDAIAGIFFSRFASELGELLHHLRSRLRPVSPCRCCLLCFEGCVGLHKQGRIHYWKRKGRHSGHHHLRKCRQAWSGETTDGRMRAAHFDRSWSGRDVSSHMMVFIHNIDKKEQTARVQNTDEEKEKRQGYACSSLVSQCARASVRASEACNAGSQGRGDNEGA